MYSISEHCNYIIIMFCYASAMLNLSIEFNYHIFIYLLCVDVVYNEHASVNEIFIYKVNFRKHSYILNASQLRLIYYDGTDCLVSVTYVYTDKYLINLINKYVVILFWVF